MPQSLTLPFYAIHLRLPGGDTLSMPLTDTGSFFLNTETKELAARFSKKFQEKVLDAGKFSQALDLLREGEHERGTLLLEFPKAKEGFHYPPFELEFDYFFQKKENAVWGILPALGIEATAANEDALQESLAEVVKVEFSSKKRLQAVQEILTAAWFGEATLEVEEIKLDFPNPAELRALQKEKKQEFLPKAAEKLSIHRQVAYGREEELGYVGRILKSKFLRNILLVGAGGCGKTVLVHEIAHRKKSFEIEGEIWETTAAVLIKELTQDTGWQDGVNFLVKELNAGRHILFVRNLAELFEVGQYEGNDVSLADYLRSFLGRGELTLISECTPEERARIEARSPGYLSFFQTIHLHEPPAAQLGEIIRKKVSDIAGTENVVIEPEAVQEIVRLQRRFSPYAGMPGKPIRFLENLLMSAVPPPPVPLSKKKSVENKGISDEMFLPRTLDRSAVIRQFCEESGMPAFIVDPDLEMDVFGVRKRFNQNVFGQERAVNAVADLLAAVKTALTRTGKPIASFLFAGPTGVGKTEMAKVLAEFMFGSRERMLRFDMSEYSDAWSVSRLIGQSYYSDGLLTSAVRREPFCVLLFDEIEKADADFFDLLLQILGEGRLSDSRGKLVNFCSAIIIMTTNIGADKLQNRPIGWKNEQSGGDVRAIFQKAVEEKFRPELVNRMDAIVAFEPLSNDTVRYVVEREIELFKKREGVRFRHLDLQLDERALDFLAEKGANPRYGARYLQRTLREEFIVPLARTLNGHDFDIRLQVRLFLENDALQIRVEEDPLSDDLLFEHWDKLTFAEQASQHRRKMTVALDGPVWQELQSEIQSLEYDKTMLREAFWQNPVVVKKYTSLTEAKERMLHLQRDIEAMESEIALACMDEGVFRTDFGERLKQWEADFFGAKFSIYERVYPAQNTCWFALFGVRLEFLLPWYLEWFRQQNFSVVQAKTVWFRADKKAENPLSAKIEPWLTELIGTLDQKGISGEARTIAINKVREERRKEQELPQDNYVKSPITTEDLVKRHFLPPAKNDVFCGVELKLGGACIWLYLMEETGMQTREILGEPDTALFYSMSDLNPFAFPDDLHRQSFYKNRKPRRTVGVIKLTDEVFKIAVDFRHEDWKLLLSEEKERRFKATLEDIFSGKEEE